MGCGLRDAIMKRINFEQPPEESILFGPVGLGHAVVLMAASFLVIAFFVSAASAGNYH